MAIICVNSSDPDKSKQTWDTSPVPNKVVEYKKYQDLKAKFLKSEAQKHEIVNQANTKITRMVSVHQEAVKEWDQLEEKLQEEIGKYWAKEAENQDLWAQWDDAQAE